MPLLVDVPLNTMLADLDESLRDLLRRELGRHGFDTVEIAFEAPARDWSSQLSAPTVDLFLYDLRETTDTRAVDWPAGTGPDGRAREVRPPLVMDCSYAVTAWAQAIEDEHRLLSQVLAVLYAYPELPLDVLQGRLANGSQRYAIEGRIGQAKTEGKADFWTAVGGQYKPSLDYVVNLSCESGTVVERGPEVRTQTLRTRDGDRDGTGSVVAELHRLGGTVAAADGSPLEAVWVALPDTGAWAASDGHGRFRFARVRAGRHRVTARTGDGREATGEVSVPGPGLALVVG